MKTFIIAEIGCNHQGNVDIALKLINEAKKAGFDAVKFQKRNPELYPDTPKNSPILGQCTYREHRRALEFGAMEYNLIDDYCNEHNIEWFASCWDQDSVEFIAQYEPSYWKIASACITDLELIACIGQQPGHVIMSTGMSDNDMVEQALRMLRCYKYWSEITLLHCCGEYPTPRRHVNLSRIPQMKKDYPNRIGYSSHDGGVPFSVVAVGLGAEVIEVHITLDRMMPGSDHAASLERRGMQTLVEHIRAVEEAMGSPDKLYYEEERKKRESLNLK